MSDRRLVNIIGGGPGGLFAARLLKTSNPDWDVRLFERLPPGETFGFGVGVTAGTLRQVRAADPDVCDDLVALSFEYSTAEFRVPTGVIEVPGFHSGVAIGRAELLRILSDHAARAGVVLEAGEAPALDVLESEADLVIAADGVSSAVRERYAVDFGAAVDFGRPYFIWCGSSAKLEGAVFGQANTEFGSVVMHAYPYASDRSTYVFEASHETLQRAGFLDQKFDSPSASDEAALTFLATTFGDVLGGAPLLGNRSRWTQFRTVTCQTWVRDNVVLLGDAAATAHPSIGSGTKLALESAISLCDEISVAERSVPEALAAYETNRRPAVDRLQGLAHHSHLWWESLEHRLDLTPARLAAAYLSRSGAVGLDALDSSAPELAVQAAADFAGVDADSVPRQGLTDWVLSQPLRAPGPTYSRRVLSRSRELLVDFDDPWGVEADDAARLAESLLAEGETMIRLTGGATPDALRDRLAFGERLRQTLNAVVEVEISEELLSQGADGLIAGRVDLLALSDEGGPDGIPSMTAPGHVAAPAQAAPRNAGPDGSDQPRLASAQGAS